jgi:hypothetical protein
LRRTLWLCAELATRIDVTKVVTLANVLNLVAFFVALATPIAACLRPYAESIFASTEGAGAFILASIRGSSLL